MEFEPEEVKELLRKDEERRRREAKRRENEILNLMEEQSIDLQGKLWGETSISAMAQKANGGNGVKWETDFEAIILDRAHRGKRRDVPFPMDPFKAIQVKEFFSTAHLVITTTWTKKQWDFFLAFLDCPDDEQGWEELAKETGYTPAGCVLLAKAIVSDLRKKFGTNPNIFPFQTQTKRVRGDLYRQLAQKRKEEGIENLPMPADLKNVRLVGKKILLSPADCLMPVEKLAEAYGISSSTASQARKRGYFYVNSYNADRVKFLDLSQPRVRCETRETLAERDGWWERDKNKYVRCALCAGELEFSVATIDHIIPRAEGGNDVLHNLCLAHEKCNREKSNRVSPFHPFLQIMNPQLPEVIVEIANRQIGDLAISEIVAVLGFTIAGAKNIKTRGFIRTTNFGYAKRAKIMARIQRIEREGWPDLTDETDLPPEKIFQIAGKKISELSNKDMEILGFDRRAAWMARKRGFIFTSFLTKAKRKSLAEKISQLEKEGRLPSQSL